MANLNSESIKKLKRGEAVGITAAAFCAAVLVFFIVAFTVAQVENIYALRIAALAVSPVLIVIGVILSAYCNLHYGALIERVISRYVQAVLLENAKLMHPERDKLSFNLFIDGDKVYMSVNGYKEKIVLDFSAFGRISALRRSQIVSAISQRLASTFFKLYERGAVYSSVNYCVNTPAKQKKPVAVIENGEPNKSFYKAYLKAQ